MKKQLLKSAILLLAALLMPAFAAFAETGTETERDQQNGNKNTTAEGKSYTIDGSYIAGTGSSSASPMTSKGLKFRTGVNGNTLEFTVRQGYTITKLYMAAIGNYNAVDPSIPYMTVSKVEVDGVSVDFDGGEFPEKGVSEAGELTVDNIEATEKIVLFFDNSNTNSGQTQINASWIIEWQRPDATQPTITVTPNTVALIPGATFKLSTHVDPATFTTQWVSSDEAVATVAEDGTVTAVAPGTATISHQWADDATVADAAVVTVADFDASAYTVTNIDFTLMGDISLEMGDKAGAIWNEANNKPNDVFFVTNEDLGMIAIQAAAGKSGKGWSIVDGEGLCLGSGAGRCAALCNLKVGQIVEIIYTGNGFYTGSREDAVRKDDGAPKTAFNEGVGRAIYRMDASGLFGFEINRGNAVLEINIYSTPLIEAKADLQEAIDKLSALAGDYLADAITEAQAAVDDPDATLQTIAVAAQNLQASATSTAREMLQKAIKLASMLKAEELTDDIAAATAVLNNSEATAEEMLVTLVTLFNESKPYALETLDLAAQFATNYGYDTLLEPIAHAKETIEAGNLSEIEKELKSLALKAVIPALDALNKVSRYAEIIGDQDLSDAIAKAQTDIDNLDYMAVIEDMQIIAEKFLPAAQNFVNTIDAIDTTGMKMATQLEAALQNAKDTLADPNSTIINIGEAIQRLVNVYEMYLKANGTVGIANINADAQQAPAYTLGGLRVINAEKGLFIINGKKVMK